jgi:hypothetical protein
MAYVSSWEPEVQYGQEESAVRDEIIKKRSEIEASQAVAIGHSHGGWVVMSMLSELSQDFGQLYTLDPISKVDCNLISPFGCQSAPPDIREDDRLQIAQSTTVWHNYYQHQTFYLHSSLIDEADGNYLRNVEHTEIDRDDQAWDDIYKNALAVF